MPRQNFAPMTRARKRLAEMKKRQESQDKFGTDGLTETFERSDAYVGKKIEETD
tara:strand:- start:1822 stop:1983 length:162 start_codon:yes stop_codon:yes gene_type:complete